MEHDKNDEQAVKVSEMEPGLCVGYEEPASECVPSIDLEQKSKERDSTIATSDEPGKTLYPASPPALFQTRPATENSEKEDIKEESTAPIHTEDNSSPAVPSQLDNIPDNDERGKHISEDDEADNDRLSQNLSGEKHLAEYHTIRLLDAAGDALCSPEVRQSHKDAKDNEHQGRHDIHVSNNDRSSEEYRNPKEIAADLESKDLLEASVDQAIVQHQVAAAKMSQRTMDARSPKRDSPKPRSPSATMSPENKLAASATAAINDFRTMFGKFAVGRKIGNEPSVQANEDASQAEVPTTASKPAETVENNPAALGASLLERLKASQQELKVKMEIPVEESIPKNDEDDESQSSSSSTNFLIRSRLLGSNTGPELAHKFKDYTYRSPTKCDICSGLLVGLFSQGLQCECCGMNVHHGQGKGEHDDCRTEAILSCCKGSDPNRNNKKEHPVQLRQAFQEVRDLAKSSPSFLQEVRVQMDKDLRSRAKKMVVKSGAEEERSKNLRRLRERLVPFLARVNGIEATGTCHAVLSLLYYHGIFVGFMVAMTVVEFSLALWPTKNGPAIISIMLYSATVLRSIHVILLLMSLGIRWASFAFQRKAVIFDQFLRDVGTIDAEIDIGISVAGAAAKFRYWSDRFVLSSATSCFALVSFWYYVQSPIMAIQEECTLSALACPVDNAAASKWR